MSLRSKRFRELFDQLREEIYNFTHSGEDDLPKLEPLNEKHFNKARLLNHTYDNDERYLAFPAADATFIMFPHSQFKNIGRPHDAITYALHAGPPRQIEKPAIGHFRSDLFTPPQLVFYAALQNQLRIAEARTDSLKHYAAWLRDVKKGRPDVFETFQKQNFGKDAALSDDLLTKGREEGDV